MTGQGPYLWLWDVCKWAPVVHACMSAGWHAHVCCCEDPTVLLAVFVWCQHGVNAAVCDTSFLLSVRWYTIL